MLFRSAAFKAQDEVDAARVDYVTALLTGVGVAPARAVFRARFAYQALIGKYAMAGPGKVRPVPEVEIEDTIALLTHPD